MIRARLEFPIILILFLLSLIVLAPLLGGGALPICIGASLVNFFISRGKTMSISRTIGFVSALQIVLLVSVIAVVFIIDRFLGFSFSNVGFMS